MHKTIQKPLDNNFYQVTFNWFLGAILKNLNAKYLFTLYTAKCKVRVYCVIGILTLVFFS